MKKILSFIYLITAHFFAYAQDTVFERISQQQLHLFSYFNNKFNGEGWDILMGKIKQSNYVLIGKDHFLNEVSSFLSAITKQIKFDNFFVEVDPYSAGILQQKLKMLSNEQFKQYKKKMGNQQ